jgi:prephenate dehydrogenase
MKNIGVIGLGLIGGSFALNLKSLYPDFNIIGIDKNNNHLEEALKLGLVDKKGSLIDIHDSDLVVLAVPVNAALKLLPYILDNLGEKSLVIDMGSTKEAICNLVENHPRRSQFLANHPIAGTEFSGPKAAHVELFNGKTNIICDIEKTDEKLYKPVIKILEAIGLKLTYMNSKDHDKHIAYVSHLSHISSFMLGKTVLEIEKTKNIIDLAGSGFESTVRLAKSSPEMWAPIFKQNKKNVTKALDDYINNLLDFKKKILKNEFDNLKNQMKEINKLTKILNRNKQ